MTIAERVKAYRLQPPYPSLRTMAQKLGITASYLSEIERGLKIPKGETLSKLAQFFGTTLEMLYEEKADLRIMQISATAVGDQVREIRDQIAVARLAKLSPVAPADNGEGCHL